MIAMTVKVTAAETIPPKLAPIEGCPSMIMAAAAATALGQAIRARPAPATAADPTNTPMSSLPIP
jgi:hypothetical protein